MKIAWLSPYGPATDIGAFSKCILDTAHVLTSGKNDQFDLFSEIGGRTYSFAGNQFNVSRFADDFFLKSYDHVIYNIGNNQENHNYINQMALRMPGVVVVHDMVMQHYLAWLIFEKIRSPLKYAEVIADLYGDHGLTVVDSSKICSQQRPPIYAPWDSDHVQSFPALELFLAKAKAVIVHSEFARQQIMGITKAPILKLGLPCDQKQGLSNEQIEAWGKRTLTSSKTQFTAFGHITQGKSLHVILNAFAEVPELKRDCRFTIAGFPRDREYLGELRRLVDLYKLHDVVSFELGVSKDRLQELKSEADVFLNLRYPNTESASGSLVEQLNCAKPVIVLDSGCYAELPDDGGVKLPVHATARDVGVAMLDLARNPRKRVMMGLQGISHARKMSSDVYVRTLLDFLKAMPAAKASSPRRKSREPDARRQVQDPSPQQLWDVALGDSLASGERTPCLETFLKLPAERLASFIQIGVLGVERQTRVEAELIHFIRQIDRLELFLLVGQTMRLMQFVRRGEMEALQGLLLRPKTLEFCMLVERSGTLPKIFFAAILGRNAGDGEADAYVQQIADSRPPREIALEILHSDEFRERSIPLFEKRGIAQAVQALPESRAGAGLALPIVTENDALDFSNAGRNARAALIGDWHEAEPEGIWSKRALSAAIFRMSGDPSIVYEVVVSCRHVEFARDQRKIQITLNEAGPKQVVRRDDGSLELHFGLSSSPLPDVLRLTLDSDKAVRPKDVGQGKDERELGVFLKSIRLVRAGVEVVPPGPTVSPSAAVAPGVTEPSRGTDEPKKTVELAGHEVPVGEAVIYDGSSLPGHIPMGWVARRGGGIRSVDGRGMLAFEAGALRQGRLGLDLVLRCEARKGSPASRYCVLFISVDDEILSEPLVELDQDVQLSIDIPPPARGANSAFKLELVAALYDEARETTLPVPVDVIVLSWALHEGGMENAAGEASASSHASFV